MLVLGHWFKSKEVCLCFVSLLTIVLKWALAEANQSGSVPCDDFDGQSQQSVKSTTAYTWELVPSFYNWGKGRSQVFFFWGGGLKCQEPPYMWGGEFNMIFVINDCGIVLGGYSADDHQCCGTVLGGGLKCHWPPRIVDIFWGLNCH